MTIFFETTEMNGSNHVKVSLRSSTILNIEKFDKYCFIWSILASLHPCGNSHPNRVSNYREWFDELNIDVCDFSNEVRCKDVPKNNELKKFIYQFI